MAILAIIQMRILMSLLVKSPLSLAVQNQRPTYDKIKGMAPMPHKSLTRLMFAGASRSGLAPVFRHLRFLSMLIVPPTDKTPCWSIMNG